MNYIYEERKEMMMNFEKELNSQSKIKIWPVVGLRANQKNCGGAWKAWSILRYVDSSGSGVVEKELIDNLIRNSSPIVSRRTWKRWIKEAIRNGFIQSNIRIKKDIETPVYILAGLVKVSYFLGLTTIGNRPAYIPLEKLIGKNSPANIWGAYLATTNQGKPISRRYMREITGVSETSQKRHEKELKVRKQKNFVITEETTGDIQGYRKFVNKNAFIYKKGNQSKGKIAYRIPDSRTVLERNITSSVRGRTRKVNQKLKDLWFKVESEDLLVNQKLFFNTNSSAIRSLKKATRCKPDRVFIKMTDKTRTGSVLWGEMRT